jgi:hypothetical protein
MMPRYCLLGYVDPSHLGDYREAHRQVWPELVESAAGCQCPKRHREAPHSLATDSIGSFSKLSRIVLLPTGAGAGTKVAVNIHAVRARGQTIWICPACPGLASLGVGHSRRSAHLCVKPR